MPPRETRTTVTASSDHGDACVPRSTAYTPLADIAYADALSAALSVCVCGGCDRDIRAGPIARQRAETRARRAAYAPTLGLFAAKAPRSPTRHIRCRRFSVPPAVPQRRADALTTRPGLAGRRLAAASSGNAAGRLPSKPAGGVLVAASLEDFGPRALRGCFCPASLTQWTLPSDPWSLGLTTRCTAGDAGTHQERDAIP